MRKALVIRRLAPRRNGIIATSTTHLLPLLFAMHLHASAALQQASFLRQSRPSQATHATPSNLDSTPPSQTAQMRVRPRGIVNKLIVFAQTSLKRSTANYLAPAGMLLRFDLSPLASRSG
jgi:hypothetical protein